jgi:hypothetical protein
MKTPMRRKLCALRHAACTVLVMMCLTQTLIEPVRCAWAVIEVVRIWAVLSTIVAREGIIR